MQQFTVPQFIDVEAKIFGPITGRQFVIMLGWFFIGAISFKLFDFSLFLTVSIGSFLIAALFAFVKINGRPFHFFLVNFLQTLRKPALRVWNNGFFMVLSDESDNELKKTEDVFISSGKRPTSSRIAELSLMVDTGGVYSGEKNNGKSDIKLINDKEEK